MKKLILILVSMVLMNVAFAVIRTVPSPYPTISSAIVAANPGDTINVGAGTFTESMVIFKNNLTIIGSGSAFPGGTRIKTIGAVPALTVSANHFKIKDMQITHNFQMREGIRVIAPAYTGLAVENVNFLKISNDAENAFGINVTTSLSGLSLINCQFTGLLSASRAMAVYGAKDVAQSNWTVNGSAFSYLYTGIYLNSSANNMTFTSNTFGPWDLQDCRQAAAALYIGDGGTSFDINNITVTNNTFTSYARGVYFLNNSANRTIGTTLISNNTFTNSIYSSGIRIVAGTDEFGIHAPSILEGPVTVSGNTFTQDSKISGGNGGSGVAMIDFRAVTGGESPTSNISVLNNNVTFGTTFDVPTWGVLLRGPIRNANINHNAFSGNPSGLSPYMPPTTAICVQTNYLDYGAMSSNAIYNIKYNSISNFVYGISAFSMLDTVYGKIPVGAVVAANSNSILNNTYGIFSDYGEYIDATNNYWGTPSGPAHSTNPGGTGNPVTDYVNFMPFYSVVPTTIVSGTVDPYDSTCYNAAEVITVAGAAGPFTVSNHGHVEMIAGKSIFFMPGTSVVSGGYLLGRISPSGPFCPPVLKSAGTGTVFSANEDAVFKAYPNPTTGKFTLMQKGEQTFSNVKMTIYNMRGEIVLSKTLSGQSSYIFSLLDQSAGFYFIRLVADDRVETIKLVKTE